MENTEKPSAPESSSSAGGAKEKVEKQARQLAYDVRYKTKQAMSQKSGGSLDPAAVRKAYASQLGKSPAAPAIKARAKQMLLGEDIIDVDRIVAQGAANAMYKVFVEKKGCSDKKKGYKEEVESISESDEKTYKIRVTDKKTGNSYVRMATRAKISELRANSNISSVEMTGYGEPTKSEKHKGSQTAAAKAGKDYDGDGKVESSRAEYKGSKDKAIKKALAKEDFTWRDAFGELIEKKSEDKKITGKGVDNSKLITVFPSEGEDVKEQVKPKEEPEAKAPVAEVDPQLAQKQKRVGLAKRQILLKKMQAVRAGAGAEITASYQPEGEVTEGNQRDPENLKKDRTRSKQPDPSKDGFTGIGNMSIKDIQKMNARMKKEEVEDISDAYTVHSADKKGNTPAWQGYKSGKKNVKTGEPLYTKGDDVKEDSEYGYDDEGKSLNPEDKKKESKKQEEEDPRGMSTKVNLVRNKLRAMGLKMSHEPEGEMVDENRMAAYTAGAGEGSPASRPTVSKKTADRVSRSSDERAFGNRKKKEGIRLSPTKKYSGKDKGKVVKRANTTGRGTPVQYRKSHEDPDMGRYQQKVTQGTGSMKNLKKEDLDPAVLNALNALDSYMKNESVGSAIDKGLSAGADVAKVAGKVAVGGVKVASKVAKGAAKTAAHVAGTPIGVAKSLKKGFKSGTQAESTDPAVLNALSALDTYIQSNGELHGSLLAKKK